MKNELQDKLLKLLKENARLSDEELASMLGVTAKEVSDEIGRLEKSGVIRGYSVIINERMLDKHGVTAFIEIKVTPKAMYGYKKIAKFISKFPEVESVRLMSGAYDLAVTVKCDDMVQIGMFVAEHLSPIDGVLNIATHFVIGRYKEGGEEIDDNAKDDREMYIV